MVKGIEGLNPYADARDRNPEDKIELISEEKLHRFTDEIIEENKNNRKFDEMLSDSEIEKLARQIAERLKQGRDSIQ